MESQWHYKSTKPPFRQGEESGGEFKTKSILKQPSSPNTISYESGYFKSGKSLTEQSAHPRTPKIVITGSVLNGNRSKIILPVDEIAAPLVKSKTNLEALKSTITAVSSGEECFRPKKKKCHKKPDGQKSCEKQKSTNSQRPVRSPQSLLSTGALLQRKSITPETPLNTEGANPIPRSPAVTKYLTQTQAISRQAITSAPKMKASLWSHSGNFHETGTPSSAPPEDMNTEQRTIALQSQPYYASVANIPTKPHPPCPCCNYHRGIIKSLKDNQKTLEEQLQATIVPQEEQPLDKRSSVTPFTGMMSTTNPYANVVSEVLEVIEESPSRDEVSRSPGSEIETEYRRSSRSGLKSSGKLEESRGSTRYQSTRSNLGQESSGLGQESSGSTRYRSTKSNLGQESSGLGQESSGSTRYRSTKSNLGQESSGVVQESSASTRYQSTKSNLGQESSGGVPESSTSTKNKSTRSQLGGESSREVIDQSNISTRMKSSSVAGSASKIGQSSDGPVVSGSRSPGSETEEKTPSRCFSRNKNKKFGNESSYSKTGHTSDEPVGSTSRSPGSETEEKTPSRCFSRNKNKKFGNESSYSKTGHTSDEPVGSTSRSPGSEIEEDSASRINEKKFENQPPSLKKMSRYLSISPGENDEFLVSKMQEAVPSLSGRTGSLFSEGARKAASVLEEEFQESEAGSYGLKVTRSVQIPSRLRGRPVPREDKFGTIVISQGVNRATVLKTPEPVAIENIEENSIHSTQMSRGSKQSLQTRPSLVGQDYFACRGTPQPPAARWGPTVGDFQPERKIPKVFDFFEPAPDYFYDLQEIESLSVSQQEMTQSLPGDTPFFIPDEYQTALTPELVQANYSTPDLHPDGRPVVNLESLRLPGSPSFRQPLPSPIFPSSSRLPPPQQNFAENPTAMPMTTIVTPGGKTISVASPSKHIMNVASKISHRSQSNQNVDGMRCYEKESLAQLPPKPTPSHYPSDPNEAPCPCCDYYGIQEEEEQSRKRSCAMQQDKSISASKVQTRTVSMISKSEARAIYAERKLRELEALRALQVPEEIEEVVEEVIEEEIPETPPPKGFLCCTKPQKRESGVYDRNQDGTPTSDSPNTEKSESLSKHSSKHSSRLASGTDVKSQSQAKLNTSSSLQGDQEPQSQIETDPQVQDSGNNAESTSPTDTKLTSSSYTKVKPNTDASSMDDVKSQKSGVVPTKSGSKVKPKGGFCCTKPQKRDTGVYGQDDTPTSDSPNTEKLESTSKHSSRSRTSSIAKSRHSAGSIKSNLSKRSSNRSGGGVGGGEDVPMEGGEAAEDAEHLDSEGEIEGDNEAEELGEEEEVEEEEDVYGEELEDEELEEEYSEMTEETMVRYTTSAPELFEIEEEQGEEVEETEEEENPEEGEDDNVEEGSEKFICSMAPGGKTPSLFTRLHDDYDPPPPPSEKIKLYRTTSDPDLIKKDEYQPCQCKEVSQWKPWKPTHWSLLKRYSDNPNPKPREVYFEALERKKLPSSILPPFNFTQLAKVPPLKKPPKGFRGLACTFELITCTQQILSMTLFPPNQLARADKKSYLMDDVYNQRTPILAIKNWDDTPDSDMIDKDAPLDHPKNFYYWLQCGICLTHPFAGSVIRILDCLHSFCSDCVEKYLFPKPMNQALSHQIMCPVCKELTTVPANKGINGIPRAFFLERIRELFFQLEKLEIPACENAAAFTLDGGGEHGMTTHQCLDCFKDFCTPCFYKHVRELDHSGMRYKDAKAKILKRQSPAVKQVCLLHDNAQIKYWCNSEECHVTSCEQCSVEAHWKKTGHQRIALSVHYPRILKKIDSYLNDIFPKSFKKIDDTRNMLRKHLEVMTKKNLTFQNYLLRRNSRAKEIVDIIVLRCKYQCEVLKETMLATVNKEIEDQKKLRKQLKKYDRIIYIASIIATEEEVTPFCKNAALTATAPMQLVLSPFNYNRTVQIYNDKPLEMSFNVFMKRKPLMRRFDALQNSVECMALKDDMLIAIHHSTMGRYPSSVVLIGKDWENIDDWIELFKYNAPNVVSVAVVDIDGVRMIAAVNRNDYMCKITTLKDKELKMVNLNDEPNNNGAGAHSICLLDTNYSKDAQRVFKSDSFSPRCVTDTPLGGFLCSDEEAMDGNCTRISRWYNENLPPKPIHEPIYFNEQLRIGRAEYMVTNMSNGDIFINDTKATNIILMDKKGIIKNVIESGLEIDDPLSPLIPKGMYFDQNEKQLYVAYPYANEIARFDANGDSKEIFLNEHDQVSGPLTLLIDPREDCLVVGSLDGSISYFTLFPDGFY